MGFRATTHGAQRTCVDKGRKAVEPTPLHFARPDRGARLHRALLATSSSNCGLPDDASLAQLEVSHLQFEISVGVPPSRGTGRLKPGLQQRAYLRCQDCQGRLHEYSEQRDRQERHGEILLSIAGCNGSLDQIGTRNNPNPLRVALCRFSFVLLRFGTVIAIESVLR
jgi:hypothetical protein